MNVQTLATFGRTPKEHRGKAILLFMDPDELDALRQLTTGHETEVYRVDISYQNIRSLSSNARFHAILKPYAKAVGLSEKEAKAQLKHEFGVIFPYREGFIPPTRDGCFVEIYGQIEFQVSTAKYTKSEMFRLSEGLDRSCAEAGVIIQDSLPVRAG